MFVAKLGGASLSTIQKIKDCAQRLRMDLGKHQKGVVVVSAMGQTTNELLNLAYSVSSRPPLREIDMLLTTGERQSAALLTMALCELGVKAISLTGSQAGIITNEQFNQAHVLYVETNRIQQHLQNHSLVVVAGFQGVSHQSKNITTLGRGGSDVSAVALAASLKAQYCVILKDIKGVYTANPTLVPNAIFLPKLAYAQLCPLSFWGGKMLHYRAALLAKKTSLKLLIGHTSQSLEEATVIEPQSSNERLPLERDEIYAVNALNPVIRVRAPHLKTVFDLIQLLEEKGISDLQILHSHKGKEGLSTLITGSSMAIQSLKDVLSPPDLSVEGTPELGVVSILAYPVSSKSLQMRLRKTLEKNDLEFFEFFQSPDGFHFVTDLAKTQLFCQIVHQELIEART